RKPLRAPPVLGKVYFLPDGRFIPHSAIHNQKKQSGFFLHPVLVTEVEGHHVFFYAMTKGRPHAIEQLNMALRLGKSDEIAGPHTLRLAPGSHSMKLETWVNLEQRFSIECENLDEWAVDVRVDPTEFCKIGRRVQELEADQNRYIYKPLPRMMSIMQPGMIIMLPNVAGASTLGAPILVLEANYPFCRFLRVKRFESNHHFNLNARRKEHCHPPYQCLSMSKFPTHRADGTPVLLLEPGYPEMREES
ncbi:hypothetical protein GQ44DRAFT_579055, partial [Phaeosphaeriaceae sp. PMI808]